MRQKKCGIYSIHQIGTDRFYVGSSVDVEHRWNGHRYDLRKGRHPSTFLQRAWDKYGEADFIFEVLEECDKDKLIEREQYWIDLIGKERLFNSAPVAGTRRGVPQSAEAIEKVRKVHLGRKNTPATIEKMRQAALERDNSVYEGHEVSYETRNRISVVTTGKPKHYKNGHPMQNPEVAAKNSASQKGKPRPWQIGTKHSQKTIAKMKAKALENRENRSRAALKRWENEKNQNSESGS